MIVSSLNPNCPTTPETNHRKKAMMMKKLKVKILPSTRSTPSSPSTNAFVGSGGAVSLSASAFLRNLSMSACMSSPSWRSVLPVYAPTRESISVGARLRAFRSRFFAAGRLARADARPSTAPFSTHSVWVGHGSCLCAAMACFDMSQKYLFGSPSKFSRLVGSASMAGAYSSSAQSATVSASSNLTFGFCARHTPSNSSIMPATLGICAAAVAPTVLRRYRLPTTAKAARQICFCSMMARNVIGSFWAHAMPALASRCATAAACRPLHAVIPSGLVSTSFPSTSRRDAVHRVTLDASSAPSRP
mmetsp:Transcript_5411/g.9576  ORF Transcript_5411/g.9576 Transcript_5411/m.9576 type:complete len:303 (+) Transcript_5411:184-1092(+)